ncbi:MAG: selenoneine synthase SenA [Alphaproteobacteria bacterium]
MTAPVTSDHLSSIMHSARQRSLDLLEGLSDDQLMGPKLPIVNPMVWEIGHVAWFHEYFILRREYGDGPMLERGDRLYDSIAIAHDTRWDLPIYSLDEIRDYMARLLDRLIDRLPDGLASERDSYLYQFTTFHEDMHDEAFTWARQTLAYPTPVLRPDEPAPDRMPATGPHPGDARIPGGVFRLGSLPEDPFVFDNEKWGHEVVVAPFHMAKAPVTNAEFGAFVEDGGYDKEALWSPDGWAWRRKQDRAHPVYWRRDGSGGWKVRLFDAWRDLAPHEPVVHVNWFEANAWCEWAGRRLPSEAEWEFAATMRPGANGSLERCACPWGDAPFGPALASMDSRVLGCVDVADHAEGDNAWGVRQLLGNVWEWTADTFAPFPGFSPDDYKEYSEPLFHDTKVLRGGSWVTRRRYVNGRYRNYFGPERWDIFAGFRTCARD